MPGTLIQAVVASTGSNPVSANLTAVQVGDLIVVAGSNGFGTNPSSWTISDNLSTPTVYNGGFWDVGAGGGQVFVQYGIAAAAGACTVSALVSGSAAVQKICVYQFRTAGSFDQYSVSIQGYNPGTSYVFEQGSGPVNLADTLIVTFAYAQLFSAQWNPGLPLDLISDTGDTLDDYAVSGPSFGVYEVMPMYHRFATGPGNTTVKLKTTNTSPGNAGFPMVVVTFSKPIARPGGTLIQSVSRSGAAQDSTAQSSGRNINNPILASLPYTPQIGAFLLVGVSYNANIPSAYAIADDYGNVYTQRVVSSGSGGSSRLALYTTIVTALPPSGEVFRVTASFTVPGSGNTYQSTTIAILEEILTGTVDIIQAAAFLTDVSAAPDITLKSSPLTVGIGDHLFGYAIYGGGAGQESIAWTGLLSYALKEQSNFLQFPSQQVNAPRLSGAVLMSKEAAASTSLDAEVLGTLTGNYAETGNIALLSFNLLALALACPITSTFTAGTDFTSQVQVSGGAPPYIFSVVGLPDGVTINASTGLISGNVAIPGTYTYSVIVVDSLDATLTVECSFTFVQCPTGQVFVGG